MIFRRKDTEIFTRGGDVVATPIWIPFCAIPRCECVCTYVANFCVPGVSFSWTCVARCCVDLPREQRIPIGDGEKTWSCQ